MKTKIKSKLSLNKTTVASLERMTMVNARGGAVTLLTCECWSIRPQDCDTYEYSVCDCSGITC